MRLIRFAGIGIAIYFVLFYGCQFFQKKRAEYQQLVTEAKNLRQQILPYQDKAQVVKKMMDDFHLDPAKLKKATVVSDASAAIQKAGQSRRTITKTRAIANSLSEIVTNPDVSRLDFPRMTWHQ